MSRPTYLLICLWLAVAGSAGPREPAKFEMPSDFSVVAVGSSADGPRLVAGASVVVYSVERRR